ncbi:Uncharacterised protein [Vibrio cholerae]|uniref:Uncharacterized protein n=1 Tax=Vibrio cholerae (strain MO10) TaxID=345072 RepID=A0A0X1L568_VIBCO|nr:conserved hypothetical protein [Vibrio cholerae MO10]CSI95659.1 Uncharacterised protein [Vibrio cholerae]
MELNAEKEGKPLFALFLNFYGRWCCLLWSIVLSAKKRKIWSNV